MCVLEERCLPTIAQARPFPWNGSQLIFSTTLHIPFSIEIFNTNTVVPQDSRYVIERSGLLTPPELEITSTIGARKIVSYSHPVVESVVSAFRAVTVNRDMSQTLC